MIQIKFNSVQEKCVEDFCKKIYNSMQDGVRKELDKWVYDNFNSILGLGIKFEENEKNFLRLLLAKYKDLKKIKEYIDDKNITIGVSNYLKDKYRKLDKKTVVKIVGTTVCPYCNRNYINVTEIVNTSQLDHFYSQEKYPIFSLCFYNLIPACFGCNNKKSNKEFLISPYDEEIKKDDIPLFTYIPKSIDFKKNKDSFDIVFEDNKFENYSESELEDEKISTQEKSNKEKFLLDLCSVDTHNLYQIHKDVVQEIFWKNEIYSDSYREILYKQYNITETEVDRIITGGYASYNELGKRSLSKLIMDISKEIGLLEEE